MDKILSHHISDLKAIDKYRKYWLALSVFVVAVVAAIVFHWNTLSNEHFVWLAVTSGLTISVVWWYWTMRVIRTLINHRIEETQVLHDLVLDIKEVKKNVVDYLTK